MVENEDLPIASEINEDIHIQIVMAVPIQEESNAEIIAYFYDKFKLYKYCILIPCILCTIILGIYYYFS